MSKTIHTEAVDQLFEAILSLKSKEECYTFLDVCTINELLSLSQRFEVAKCCSRKKRILRFPKNRCVHCNNQPCKPPPTYGNDGYEMVFERLEHQMTWRRK